MDNKNIDETTIRVFNCAIIKNLIYVDNDLILWMGYSGKDASHRRNDFKNLLNKFNIETDYFVYTNEQYKLYIQNLLTNNPNIEYHPIDVSNQKNQKKHILVTGNCLKQMVISLKTKRGEIIRKDFVKLETDDTHNPILENLFINRMVISDPNEKQNWAISDKITIGEQILGKYPNGNCVYFVGNENFDGDVKIGKTNNLNKRLRSLNNGNPNKLIVYKQYIIQDKHKFEQIVHKRFTNKKIKLEWYKLTKEDLEAIYTEFK